MTKRSAQEIRIEAAELAVKGAAAMDRAVVSGAVILSLAILFETFIRSGAAKTEDVMGLLRRHIADHKPRKLRAIAGGRK